MADVLYIFSHLSSWTKLQLMPVLHVHTVELHMLEWTSADQNKYLSKWCTIFSIQRHLPCKATISEAPTMVKNCTSPMVFKPKGLLFLKAQLCTAITLWFDYPDQQQDHCRNFWIWSHVMYETWWFPETIRSLQGHQQNFWIRLNNRVHSRRESAQVYMWGDNIWVLNTLLLNLAPGFWLNSFLCRKWCWIKTSRWLSAIQFWYQ